MASRCWSLLTGSARESALGKALAGTEPSGPGGIQVRLEKASFDAMIGWLSRLSQQNGISVDGATIDTAGAPGVVNAVDRVAPAVKRTVWLVLFGVVLVFAGIVVARLPASWVLPDPKSGGAL